VLVSDELAEEVLANEDVGHLVNQKRRRGFWPKRCIMAAMEVEEATVCVWLWRERDMAARKNAG
jgi:hypothetical protein